jgi:hypothetical protein
VIAGRAKLKNWNRENTQNNTKKTNGAFLFARFKNKSKEKKKTLAKIVFG